MRDSEPLRTRPPGELLARLFGQIGDLLRNEFALARGELRVKAVAVAGAAMLIGVALVFAGLAAIAMLVTTIVVLRTFMPLWAAALVAMAVAATLAAVFAVIAQARLASALPLVPERTLQSLKEDLLWTKTRLLSNDE